MPIEGVDERCPFPRYGYFPPGDSIDENAHVGKYEGAVVGHKFLLEKRMLHILELQGIVEFVPPLVRDPCSLNPTHASAGRTHSSGKE